MTTILLPLDQIRTDADTQMRIATSDKTVNEYCEELDELPPIVVFQVDGEYILADGFHRFAAYQKCGRDTILCDVKQGMLDDAREYACCANKAHGLRRTDDDKRKAVKAFFQIPGRDTLTNSEVGRRLGVTTPFVKTVRDEMGVKASPASHHGAGSAKRRLNDLIPTDHSTSSMETGLNDLIPPPPAKGSKTIDVSLPTKDKHGFTVALMSNFDLEYLKSCTEYFSDLVKK
jgi:uncharacterized ParB-like nuclease family protein